MKQIFTLIAVLVSITTFAAPAPGPKTSKISISTLDRSVTQVKIDGKMYNLNNTFVLDNIRAGLHTIGIYQSQKIGFRQSTKVIYNSSVSVTPGQMINIDINRNGKVVVKTTTDKFDRNDRNDHYDRNANKGYNDHDNRNNNNGRH